VDALPLEIIQKRGSDELRIRWDDGHESVTALVDLRMACPCAGCNDRRREGRLAPPPALPPLAVAEIHPVGAYAIRFKWSDGHDTGLFAWPLLRGLCRCARCAPVPPTR
jgi:DUF971 family protein